MSDQLPRRFHLQRDTDVSGVSGTGRVANGVVWPDGTVSLRWTGDRPSAVFWDQLEHAEYIHGHQGATRIVWDDAPAVGDIDLSEYDFLELVAFSSKTENEGFGYAFEEYPPRFEAPELAPVSVDYGVLKALCEAHEDAVAEFWTRADAEAVYDAHIDEDRRRRRGGESS